MKKILYLLFLLLSFLGFSQNQVSFTLGKTNSSFQANSPTLSIKNISLSFNLTDYRKYTDENLLVIYNPITQMNDHYVNISNQYHLTNTKSFSLYGIDGTKIDSFNPNGVSDFGSAIASGILNLFLEKF
nr:hypothetical protein [uncultured Flavobacterium sp.]